MRLTRPRVIIENFPTDYSGPPFLTLIEYRNQQFITVVDCVTASSVSAYVLDRCRTEQLDEAVIVSMILKHWDEYKDKPISILFGVLGFAHHLSRIYQTFPLSEISRIMGRYPTHDVISTKVVKRRRRREIGRAIEIH